MTDMNVKITVSLAADCGRRGEAGQFSIPHSRYVRRVYED
jgi:hypothetical protein